MDIMLRAVCHWSYEWEGVLRREVKMERALMEFWHGDVKRGDQVDRARDRVSAMYHHEPAAVMPEYL